MPEPTNDPFMELNAHYHEHLKEIREERDRLLIRVAELEAEAKEARDEAEQAEDVPNAHRLKLVGVIRSLSYQKGMLRDSARSLHAELDRLNDRAPLPDSDEPGIPYFGNE